MFGRAFYLTYLNQAFFATLKHTYIKPVRWSGQLNLLFPKSNCMLPFFTSQTLKQHSLYPSHGWKTQFWLNYTVGGLLKKMVKK